MRSCAKGRMQLRLIGLSLTSSCLGCTQQQFSRSAALHSSLRQSGKGRCEWRVSLWWLVWAGADRAFARDGAHSPAVRPLVNGALDLLRLKK